MNLDQQVVNLGLAKKLKEFEVKQQSLFYWRLGYSTSEQFRNGKSLGKEGHFRNYELTYLPKPRLTTADIKWNECDLQRLSNTEISAYTVAELGELLPPLTETKIGKGSYHCIWWSGTPDPNRKNSVSRYHLESADTEVDARAKMLVYLLENNLLNIKG